MVWLFSDFLYIFGFAFIDTTMNILNNLNNNNNNNNNNDRNNNNNNMFNTMNVNEKRSFWSTGY